MTLRHASAVISEVKASKAKAVMAEVQAKAEAILEEAQAEEEVVSDEG